jgi:hypothetical protein
VERKGKLMRGFRKVALGALIGGLAGLAIPVVFALLYLAFGGDPQAGGAISFFPIVLIPLGAFLGGVAGRVWSPERSTGENLLAVLWKVVKPWWT